MNDGLGKRSNSAIITVDCEKCTRCNICVAECPTKVIQVDPDDNYPVSVGNAKESCIKCGHCIAVCPNRALSLKWFGPEDCPLIREEFLLSQEQVEQFLRARRSIRDFEEKPVERNKLKRLIELGNYAPSAKNMQSWHWLIVENKTEVRRLDYLVKDWMVKIIDEDPTIAESVMYRSIIDRWERGLFRFLWNAPHIIVAHADENQPFSSTDCALALCYIDLFANALGLGTCWVGYFFQAANLYPPLRNALAIPKSHRVFGSIIVGYPKARYYRLPLRRRSNITWT